MFFGVARTSSTQRVSSKPTLPTHAEGTHKIDNMSKRYLAGQRGWEDVIRQYHNDASAASATRTEPRLEHAVPVTTTSAVKGRPKTAKLKIGKQTAASPQHLKATPTTGARAVEPLALVFRDDVDDEAQQGVVQQRTSVVASSSPRVVKAYHAAPSMSLLALFEQRHDAAMMTAAGERRHLGRSPANSLRNDDETTGDDTSTASPTAAPTSAAWIEGPRVQRSESNWEVPRSPLLDDEEAPPQCGASPVSPQSSCNQEDVTKQRQADFATAFPRLPSSINHGDDDTRFCGVHVDQFVRRVLDEIWVLTHPSADFDSEADRAKTIPRLVDQSIKYMVTLLLQQQQQSATTPTTSGSLQTASSSSVLCPFPRFYESSVTKQTNRLMRWLKTWRREHHEVGAGGASPFGDSSSDVDEAEPPQHHNKVTGGHGDVPLTSLDHDVMLESSFLFDSRGGRHSARIAKKEALDRQREEEEERARQQRRGYFSNDTSALGGAVSTAGGEGSMTNIVVVSGPSGIGKTAAAYYAAGRMGYRVVEINTSTKRSPKILEKLIAEATQSRQIQNNGSNVSGRSELEKWRAEAEERQLQEAAAAELSRKRQEVELAEQRAKQEAIDAAALEAAKKSAKRAAGVKKENAISKAAIASFFTSRVKSKPPPDAEVLDVDVVAPPPPSALVTVIAEDDEDGASDSVSVLPADPHRLHEGGETPATVTKNGRRKRGRSEADNTDSSPTAVAVVNVDNDSPLCIKSSLGHNASVTSVTSPNSSTTPSVTTLLPQPERLPLILIESADVLLDDEVPRAFYTAIRAMAAESKYPIIVTSNQTFTPQQVNSYFGLGTPMAIMEAPTLLHVVAQLIAIVLVERQLVAATTSSLGKDSLKASQGTPVHTTPSCSEDELERVLQVVLTAVQSSSDDDDATAANDGGGLISLAATSQRSAVLDIRRCLNQLRFLLLGAPAEDVRLPLENAQPHQNDANLAALQSAESSELHSVIDVAATCHANVVASASSTCFPAPCSVDDDDDDDVPARSISGEVSPSSGTLVALRSASSAPVVSLATVSGTARSLFPGSFEDHGGEACLPKVTEEQQQQVRLVERANLRLRHDVFTALLQPALAWFPSSCATFSHLEQYARDAGEDMEGNLVSLSKPQHQQHHQQRSGKCRAEMCSNVVTMLHRTRSLAAKAYATRSPSTMFDILQFGALANATQPGTRK